MISYCWESELTARTAAHKVTTVPKKEAGASALCRSSLSIEDFQNGTSPRPNQKCRSPAQRLHHRMAMSSVESPPGIHQLLLEARRRFEFRNAVKQSPRTAADFGKTDTFEDYIGVDSHMYVNLSLLWPLEIVPSADVLWAWEAVELDGFDIVAIVEKKMGLDRLSIQGVFG